MRSACFLAYLDWYHDGDWLHNRDGSHFAKPQSLPIGIPAWYVDRHAAGRLRNEWPRMAFAASKTPRRERWRNRVIDEYRRQRTGQLECAG